MSTPLELTVENRPDGTSYVIAVGQIDMSNSAALARTLAAAAGDLTVDLTAVDYLDSAGLNVLFANSERLEVVANPLLQPVLAISGLSKISKVRTPGPGSEDLDDPATG